MRQWGSGAVRQWGHARHHSPIHCLIAPLPHCLIAPLVIVTFSVSACSRSPSSLDITLTPGSAARPAVVRVTGLSSAEIEALRGAGLDTAGWQSLLGVTVAGGTGAGVAGRFAIAHGTLEFTPAFPFDPGREYLVRFDPGKLPQPRAEAVVERRVSLPAGPARTTSTVVSAIHPSADVWPENVLRFYLHFSAPMSRSSSVGFVRLVDDRGVVVTDALLEMDVDLWNDDRTRCTVFFDPGRVKRGIRPNRELGRALKAGRRYAIVVDAAWKDQWGQPLKAAYRHEFTAGPPIERGISTADWRIMTPVAGTQDAVAIAFAWPLDHGLLQRTLGIQASDGRPVAGEVRVDALARHWRFVPASAWRAGRYQIVIDQALEDPAGNQIGRAFEIDDRDPLAQAPRAARVVLPLQIRASGS
jgi:hypothetical protein